MTGLSFSTPWFHSGLGFGGISTFVDCADELDAFHGDCRSLKVCVVEGSTHVDTLQEVLKGTALHLVNDTALLDETFESGLCNVIAGEASGLGASLTLRTPSPTE